MIDARELLTSTARVVGATLGELHFKAWMALITIHVAGGMPETGWGSSAVGEFGRIVWGPEKSWGGKETRQLHLGLVFDSRWMLPASTQDHDGQVALDDVRSQLDALGYPLTAGEDRAPARRPRDQQAHLDP